MYTNSDPSLNSSMIPVFFYKEYYFRNTTVLLYLSYFYIRLWLYRSLFLLDRSLTNGRTGTRCGRTASFLCIQLRTETASKKSSILKNRSKTSEDPRTFPEFSSGINYTCFTIARFRCLMPRSLLTRSAASSTRFRPPTGHR